MVEPNVTKVASAVQPFPIDARDPTSVRRAFQSIYNVSPIRLLHLRRLHQVRRALRDQPKLAAGIAAALLGGVVSSVVNDSGVVAGAGLWCAALAASLYVAARPQEAPA